MEPFSVWVGEVYLVSGLRTWAVAQKASGSLESLPSHDTKIILVVHQGMLKLDCFGERKRKQPVRWLRIQMLEKDAYHQDPKLCSFPVQQFWRQAFSLSFGLCGILSEVMISACS